MLAQYRSVLTLPGARELLAWSLLARATFIGWGAILLIAAYGVTESWMWASIAAAVGTGCAAISSWCVGKLMDHFPPRRVLLISAPGALVLALLTVAQSPLQACLIAGLAGFFRPGGGTALRTVWTSLCPDQETRVLAFAMEAGLVPFAGALGAAGAGLIAASWGAAQVALVTAGVGFFSVVGLGLCKAVRDAPVPRRHKGQKSGRLPGKVWAALLAVAGSWFALSACEVGLGQARGAAQLGYLTGLSMVAVAGGAHLYASRGRAGNPLKWVAGGLTLATAAMAGLIAGVWLLIPAGLLVMALGAGRGVISPSVSLSIGKWAGPARQSEAMGLYGTFVLLGQATGKPLAGLLPGAGWSMALGAVVSLGCAAVAFRAAE